jgi:WD40 repeat protein
MSLSCEDHRQEERPDGQSQGREVPANEFTLERGGKEIVKVRTGPPVISEERQFIGHKGFVFNAAFCFGSKSVLSSGGSESKNGVWLPGSDFALRICDVKTGKELRRFGNHTSAVLRQAVSPDGRYALSAGGGTENDFSIRYWNLETCTDGR